MRESNCIEKDIMRIKNTHIKKRTGSEEDKVWQGV